MPWPDVVLYVIGAVLFLAFLVASYVIPEILEQRREDREVDAQDDGFQR